MIVIFSYKRYDMLKEAIKPFAGHDVLIVDDGSGFTDDQILNISRLDENYVCVVETEHNGKQGWYKNWNVALEYCKKSNDDFFMFSADDFLDVDMTQVMKWHDCFKDRAYAMNLINDGREQNFWYYSNKTVRRCGEEIRRIGWVDCGFFCNRKTLEKINFQLNHINLSRFRKPGISSGVGQQLTNRFRTGQPKVEMYKPFKSLAYHGDHESHMHPEERKENPLISK